jgi:negative regulator of flagellin synthesis FlgM
MSYSNGLGNLQHLLGNLATNASPNSKVTDQTSASGTTTTVARRPDVDATSLSSASGLVSQSVAGSDVRADKVAALQQAIAAGTYKVSANDVATSIINSLLS